MVVLTSEMCRLSQPCLVKVDINGDLTCGSGKLKLQVVKAV
jgi:hypothetical protein